MKELQDTFYNLKDLFVKLIGEKKRYYGEDWSDWDDGRTGGQKHPCVYILWQESDNDRTNYIGETTNLGKRLDEHDKSTGWSKPKWRYVQYISDERLKKIKFRRLFESFCIWILNPKDNA